MALEELKQILFFDSEKFTFFTQKEIPFSYLVFPIQWLIAYKKGLYYRQVLETI